MRLLAHRASLHDAPRMVMGLEGLARRGHVVAWTGGASSLGPAGVELRAQVVVGGVDRPLRTALTGWLAGAQVMLLDLHASGLDRWGWLDRWAWGSLYGAGLVDEAEAAGLAANPRGLAHDRIGLWPAAPAASTPDPAHPDVEVLERALERALARHHGGGARAAVFLDRDGTLVQETGYLSDPDRLELLPGVAGALRDLAVADLPLVVISNQSGVARGMFTEADVHAVMARLRRTLREQGVELSGIYFCPHQPGDGCPCRKPRTGLLERAAEDLGLALGASVMIGDKRIDAATGRFAGGQGILVRTGYGREEQQRVDTRLPAPDYVADDLPAAAAWWLDRS